MGFFDLFKPKPVKAAPKRRKAAARKAAPKSDKPPLVVPYGTFKAELYAYHWNGGHLRPGEKVQLTYHPGKRKLTSDFTGNSESADGTFSYLGQTVGCTFNGYYLQQLKPLAKKHSVKVWAVCQAWNRKGYPELRLQSDFKAVKEG